jgi:hypothetical protein
MTYSWFATIGKQFLAFRADDQVQQTVVCTLCVGGSSIKKTVKSIDARRRIFGDMA